MTFYERTGVYGKIGPSLCSTPLAVSLIGIVIAVGIWIVLWGPIQ